VPPTAVCQNADSALEAFASLGGDVVVKPIFGSEGRGMMRICDPDLAWRTFRVLERTQSILYLQKYIHHPGWDLRVFVLGKRVIAAMRRRANGHWRTNVAQGGKAEPVALSSPVEELALCAAEVVEAPLAGIDLLPGPDDQMFVLEVNAVPGWRALAPVTGVDIAKEIVLYFTTEFQNYRARS
jgi:RimK family alpha-L-glutamate ligase